MSIFDSKNKIADIIYAGFPEFSDYNGSLIVDFGYIIRATPIDGGWCWERAAGNMIDGVGIESVGIILLENPGNIGKYDVRLYIKEKRMSSPKLTDYINWRNYPLKIAKNMAYSTMKKFKEPGCLQDLISHMKNNRGYFYDCYKKNIKSKSPRRDDEYFYLENTSKISFANILMYKNEHIQ